MHTNNDIVTAEELVELVKKNLILTHNEDDALIAHVVGADTSYAASFQHQPPNHYEAHGMSGATRQAIIMLATHFYESRDGSTAGFWNTQPHATSGVWLAVHNLLRLDKNWQI